MSEQTVRLARHALACLFTDAPEPVARDVRTKVEAAIAKLEASLAAAQRDLDAERQAHAATRGLLSYIAGWIDCIPSSGVSKAQVAAIGAITAALKMAGVYPPADEDDDAALAATPPPIGTGYGKPSNSPAELLDLDTGPAIEADCPLCGDSGWITEDVAQAGDQTLIETYRCTRCGGPTP